MARKKTASAEPTSTAITTAETAIVPVDSGIMAIADDHTSTKLITDQEAMERLGQAVDIAVQRAEDAIPAAGINLLRGTRDFTLVTTNQQTGSYGKNGFTWSDASVVNEDDGFSSISIKSSSSSRLYCSAVIPDKNDYNINDITISFYILVENEGTISNTYNFMSVAVQKFGSGSDVAVKNYSVADIFNVGNVNEIVKNKLYKCIINFHNTWNVDYDFYCIVFRNNIGSTVHVKKIKAEYGNIANPTWSPNPFDIDTTARKAVPSAGINLLRGTRDFSNAYGSGYSKDGFMINSSSIEKTNDGFWSFTTSSNGVSAYSSLSTSAYRDANDFTFCFEVMFDDLSKISNDTQIFKAMYIYADISSDAQGSPAWAGVSQLVGDKSTLIENKWYKVIYYAHANAQTKDYCIAAILRNNSNTGGNVSFRKLCAFDGIIENPTWSASPFDLVEKSDNKILWSGTITEGSIEIPGLRDYKVIGLGMNLSGNDNPTTETVVFCRRTKDTSDGTQYLMGVGGGASSTSSDSTEMRIISVRADVTANTLQYRYANMITIGKNGISNFFDNRKICTVYGIQK